MTKYICKRCSTPIDVPSESFYRFGGPNDTEFWCTSCEDLPYAECIGIPAESLPRQLQLLKDFICYPVPRVEPVDVKRSNILYRPYSKRSFLRQYIDWLMLKGENSLCKFTSDVTVFSKFDPDTQEFTQSLDYEIEDLCNGSSCQFLCSAEVKPIDPTDIHCGIIKLLTKVKAPFGLCQTGDEAMILWWYLLLTGGDHYPMLIPQPTILSGEKRPDFICYVPVTKFQYKGVVVQVDRPGKDKAVISAENLEYESIGFTVKRIVVDEKQSYLKMARELKLCLESL